MDEAPKLFEVDEALPIEHLNQFLTAYAKASPGFMLWYDFRQPIDLKVHQILNTFVSDAARSVGKVCQSFLTYVCAVIVFLLFANYFIPPRCGCHQENLFMNLEL